MKKIIATHNGIFHCDQVLACVLLTQFTHKFQGANILRSRDPQLLSKCDIVVDVGGVYQPPYKLDHHQKQFSKSIIPPFLLSSAGLTFLHYPEIVTFAINKICPQYPQFKIPDQTAQKEISQSIYKNFILSIDANDNGQLIQNRINHCLWNRVQRFNPNWWEDFSQEQQMKRFRMAMDIVQEEFKASVLEQLSNYWSQQELVKQIKNIQSTHPSKKILKLEKLVDWKGIIYKLEKQLLKKQEIQFVIYKSISNNDWRVQSIPIEQIKFSKRKGLKKEWRGIKNLQLLQSISGIQDIVFVHNNGFIGGAKTYQNALKMAEISIKQKNIWIDSDPGVDDMLTILMCSIIEQCNLIGISTTFGNSNIMNTTQNAINLCKALKLKLPIVKGEGKNPTEEDTDVHGEKGLFGFRFDGEFQGETAQGVHKIVEYIEKLGQKVSFVAIGPLTNIARLFKEHPHLTKYVEEISIMGGGINLGNITPESQFNFYCNPEAAQQVLNIPVPKILHPLNLTSNIRLNQQFYSQISQAQCSQFGKQLSRILQQFRQSSLTRKSKNPTAHDLSALYYLISKEEYKTRQVHLEVSKSGKCSIVEGKQPNCIIASEFNPQNLLRKLVQSILKATKK